MHRVRSRAQDSSGPSSGPSDFVSLEQFRGLEPAQRDGRRRDSALAESASGRRADRPRAAPGFPVGQVWDFPKDGGATIKYGKVQIAVFNFTSSRRVVRHAEHVPPQEGVCPFPGHRGRRRRRPQGRLPAAQKDVFARHGPVAPGRGIPDPHVPGADRRRRRISRVAADGACSTANWRPRSAADWPLPAKRRRATRPKRRPKSPRASNRLVGSGRHAVSSHLLLVRKESQYRSAGFAGTAAGIRRTQRCRGARQQDRFASDFSKRNDGPVFGLGHTADDSCAPQIGLAPDLRKLLSRRRCHADGRAANSGAGGFRSLIDESNPEFEMRFQPAAAQIALHFLIFVTRHSGHQWAGAGSS